MFIILKSVYLTLLQVKGVKGDTEKERLELWGWWLHVCHLCTKNKNKAFDLNPIG